MFLTLKQLARKIKKSEGTARVYIDRFNIKRIKLKNTKQIVYELHQELLKEVIKFSLNRRKNANKNRNRKTN